jgi:hypothetical protein
MDRKTCPVCNKSYGHREILRHVRLDHPGVALSRSSLQSLGAKHCAQCKQVVSNTGKGRHDCVPASREFKNSVSTSSARTSQGAQKGFVPQPVNEQATRCTRTVPGPTRALDRDVVAPKYVNKALAVDLLGVHILALWAAMSVATGIRKQPWKGSSGTTALS